MRAAFPAQRPSLPRVWPYSLTVTPQPEALLTMASTLPDSSSGHQASMLVRIAALPPSWSSRWKASAPQQPALAAIRVCMPAASSTRAVARLMLGSMAGCTQPASSSTRRACWPAGPAPASCPAGTLALSAAGSRPRSNCPAFIAGANSGEGRPSFSAQRRACSPSGRDTCSSTILRPMSSRWPYCTPLGQVLSQLRQVRQRSRGNWVFRLRGPASTPPLVQQIAVLPAAGAGAFAVAASQATVHVQLGFAARGLAFQHLLDQVDAPARAVELIAEQLVGGAGGAAKAAVHALAQYGFGFQAVGTVAVFGGESGLHGVDQRCA